MRVREWLENQDQREQLAAQRKAAEPPKVEADPAPAAQPTPRAAGRPPRWIFFVGIAALVLVVAGAGVYSIHRVVSGFGGYMGGGFASTQAVTMTPLPPMQVQTLSMTPGAPVIDLTPVVLATNAPTAATPPQDHASGQVSRGNELLNARTLGTTRVINPPAAVMGGQSAPPLLHNGRVFVGGGFGGMTYHAVDAATGTTLWSANLSDNGPSAAAAAGDTVVINTESCTIFALDTQSGSQRWSRWLGDPLVSSPTIAGGLVYTTYPVTGYPAVQLTGVPAGLRATYTPTHVLAAMDLSDGGIVWQRWVDGEAVTAPVVVDGRVHMVSFSGTRYAFDAGSGQTILAVHDRSTSAPSVVDDHVYFTARYDDSSGNHGEAVRVASATTAEAGRTLHRVEAPWLDPAVRRNSQHGMDAAAADASVGWGGGAPPTANALLAEQITGVGRVASMHVFQGSRVAADANADLLVSTMGDQLVCVDAQDGALVWSRALSGDPGSSGGWLAGPPTVRGGRVFAATATGELLVLDLATGSLLDNHLTHGSVLGPVQLAEGHAVVGTLGGGVTLIPLQP
jgi:outer membrane protein assembly factor BamB